MKKVIAAIVGFSLVLCAYGQAKAGSLVGISFGPQAGPTNWTTEAGLASGSATNLIAEDASSSGIDLSYSITPANGNPSALSGVTLSSATVPVRTPSLTSLDGNIDTLSGGSFSATLSNLAKGGKYDVWVLLTRQNFATDQDVVITGAATTSFTQTDATTKQLILNASIGSSAQSFESYALPITASNAGTIDFDITGNASGFAISGIAIEAAAVPLPSAAWAGLLLLGGIGAVKLRRRIA